MTNKKVHFVCSGNVFRSRLAEAYARSLQIPGYDFSSSGIRATKYPESYLSRFTRDIARHEGINPFITDHRTLSTQALFDDSDIIVFMHPYVYEAARQKFVLNHDKVVIWRVKDQGDYKPRLAAGVLERRTSKHVKRSVQRLSQDLQHGSWVDIVDGHNQPRNFSLPITIANQKQLWHRGCHALLTTPNQHVVVQRRSNKIIFSPKMVDITLGGHVDSHETPKEAILREIKEELGLTVNPEQLQLLEIYKQSRYHPRYKRHARSFTYTYHIPLLDNRPVFTPQRSEVSKVALLSPAKTRKLVARHRLRGLGKLNYTYAYYRYLLSEIGLV